MICPRFHSSSSFSSTTASLLSSSLFVLRSSLPLRRCQLLADLRASQRAAVALRERLARFDRAQRSADFATLGGCTAHRVAGAFEALIATLGARMVREADELKPLERAGLQLQRAALLYRQGA